MEGEVDAPTATEVDPTETEETDRQLVARNSASLFRDFPAQVPGKI